MNLRRAPAWRTGLMLAALTAAPLAAQAQAQATAPVAPVAPVAPASTASAASAASTAGAASAPGRPAPPPIDIKPLGNERFQIGSIVVDKRAGSFVVPGRVNVVNKPLEYLATSARGMKAYETLLELNARGSEFNLACILVGLERDPAGVAARSYRRVPQLIGPRVRLSVAWTDAGQRRLLPAAQVLLNPEAGVDPATVEWAYVGAPASDARGRFTPDDTGTLIGFVHDPNTIIESVAPIGLGAYGSVRGHAMLPAPGTAVELIVEAGSGKK
ncbi:hypothetical protein BurJ1DRAFT_1478 [Burkholderiales bacterium JOSHI_001]|nr:hypothetical protein BurJ1DRAFT_1478 [Burkholderiales bacterium JOSHI_001]